MDRSQHQLNDINDREEAIPLCAERDNSNTSDDSTSTSYKTWTRHQWIVLFTQYSLVLSSNLAYELLGTFFPQEAVKKGADSFTIGLIFGVYELVIFFLSPIFGMLVSQLVHYIMNSQ